MHRLATHKLAPWLAVPACLLLLPLAAAAAEGGLELLPDFTTTLPGLIVVFVILVVPLNALIFKPLIRALDQREERIAGTRARAERLAADAQSVLERYESAIREAREGAEGERRLKIDGARARMLEATASARSAAEAELERARAQLATELDHARGSLRDQADELAREAATRVLGRAV